MSETNLEKYQNPEKYDELYEHYQDDYLYIMEYARHINRPIIDLACGTGRVTIPLSKKGLTMIGVDLHAGMLDRAKQKATQEQLDIRFEQQDCSNLDLGVQSPLIFMTGNSFQHFLTNESQDALFESVKKHLASGGGFIFDTRNPILAELSAGDVSEERYLNSNNQTVIEKHTEEYDHHSQILHCTTETIIQEREQSIQQSTESIALRYTYPLELKRLLATHGFEWINIHGSWKKTVFEESSPQMIVHCKIG
ncbi:class I SAM-dependent methyltransferase [Alkalicoccobacillus murimartini]|uniref:SAM-dependent methyltransferase n=1 Tax=Alkalicoccobacillus murimartini TaxID=171685 RepID=A0ABT9YI46_9BACI|nr:class I SAM-dependent methyltransferase [Alkalicoccobacillus murimartini]MDQ0207530.1 SAM-dependent methyltransferase [Alkalicoccobacillus murimartini]